MKIPGGGEVMITQKNSSQILILKCKGWNESYLIDVKCVDRSGVGYSQ